MVSSLPGTLQVSFAMERERFVWWGVDDPGAEARRRGWPVGAPERLAVALPDDTGRNVEAVTVPVALVEPGPGWSALASFVPGDGESASVREWARLARLVRDHPGNLEDPEVDAPAAQTSGLPTAAHAVVGLDGTSIWSASAVVATARRAAAPRRADGLSTVLRPYQRAGVAWIRAAVTHGGGILADDMGLGKTLQAIALLAGREARPHLVVCPTSVLGAWTRELERFAPAVDVVVHRGAHRGPVAERARPGTVVLTSYGLLRADADTLADVAWDVVVLDEAQQIKNPDARAARAARRLVADLRIAMTGTPVENRLDELWSLLAFTNPGLLGTRARFRRRFAVAVEQQRSATAAACLHEIVGPHVLRRRKVDVAPELPARIVVPVPCTMTAEQESLYRRAVDEAFTSGLGDGMHRRGRILALLTRLKLVVNHPEHDRPEREPGRGSLAGRSGKLDRCVEILSEVLAAGERALVFTQFRRTGELLAEHLAAEVTGRDVPFLHGGLPGPRREELVRRFQEDADPSPVLVLSLRAAGFGLTLTRATHVVHYDRWWNPAVEDQASDRAHRIGQTSPVTIHTLATERTLEEALDAVHRAKRDVAGTVLGAVRDAPASDGDLARLSDDVLRALLDGDRTSR